MAFFSSMTRKLQKGASQNASQNEQSPDREEPREFPPEIFQVPLLAPGHKSHDLRINVPKKDFELGEAIDLSEKKPASYANTLVSQLPTPIISGGGFSNMLVPPKRANRGSTSTSRNRAVSEFVPSHFENNAAQLKVTGSRNVSNPVEFQAPVSLLSIPLPPLEFDLKVTENLIYSPLLRSYFAPGEVIGSGSFSTVIQAHQISDSNVVVAIKIISVPTTDLASITNFKSYITRELSILSHLSHPCIVRLFDYNLTMSISRDDIVNSYNIVPVSKSVESFDRLSSKDELERLLDENDLRVSNKQYYFLQYCPGGNLFQYMEKHYASLSHETSFWKFASRVSAELIATVAYLHTERVVHRDIKLENILLNQKFDDTSQSLSFILSAKPTITLTDFGLSKRIAHSGHLLTTKCGSQDYVSPELLMGLEYDGILLDSWAVGVVIYAILENRLPFDIPPLEFMEASNISPSVIKRRRMRHNPGYRIAMIDWDWYRTLSMINNKRISEESKEIIKNLMAVVDSLLVRKEKRRTVSDLLHDSDFFWIRTSVPQSVLQFDSM
ncbi:hypothetical protein PUMCH_000241 [Australozyma saopauloensis]|uniref:Protein kinase domain-containing protein n=1 Tax=Australozyma saopauloensis TaxID=291208 RepID=A0AAX4H3B5_9ASCO|nr:hypothetical protein PUMCH_000241 [[Candida] saopauloensis]